MKDTKTDLNVKISIDNKELNSIPGCKVIVSIGNIQVDAYLRFDENINDRIGKLVSECLEEIKTFSLIKLNNMKAFD